MLLLLLWANLLTVGVIVGVVLVTCLAVVAGIGELFVRSAWSIGRKAFA